MMAILLIIVGFAILIIYLNKTNPEVKNKKYLEQKWKQEERDEAAAQVRRYQRAEEEKLHAIKQIREYVYQYPTFQENVWQQEGIKLDGHDLLRKLGMYSDDFHNLEKLTAGEITEIIRNMVAKIESDRMMMGIRE